MQLLPAQVRLRAHHETLARRALYILPVVLSAAFLLYFVVIAAARASFPLQLEWLECGVLDSVARITRGQPIYVEPTHRFVPYLYTPLYYYLGAGMCRLFGLGFTPLRWLSTLCTLGCFGFLYRLTRELTGSPRAGLLASGLFAALYASAAAGWYDLARVDMLSLFLTLAAIYALWRDRPIAAAVLFAFAYQSKQGALIIALCALASLWRRPRQCATAIATFLALALVSTLYLNHVTNGWYRFYTNWVPSHQPLTAMGFVYFGARDLGRYLLPALLLMVWAVRTHRAAIVRFPRSGFLFFCALGTALAALVGRVHTGGGPNVTIPLFAWIAVLFGVVMHRFRDQRRFALVASSLACLQFAVLFNPPARLLPSRIARLEAKQFVENIAGQSGDIYVVNNAADLLPAGKSAFANSDAVFDVLRTGDGPVSRALRADLEQSFRDRRYSAILAPSPIIASAPPVGLPTDLAIYFDLTAPPAWNGSKAAALQAVQPPHIGPVYLYPARNAPR
jgi:Dolichyl-phosphate-mannose-protein mannosyltransferase